MFGWGVVFTFIAFMVITYLGGVSDDGSDFCVGTILFLVVFTLGYILNTLIN